MAEVYKISKTDGTVIEIQPRSIINKYSLNLVGDDAIEYGERMAETTLRSSENFANTTYPSSATIGQLWCKLVSPSVESTPFVSGSSSSVVEVLDSEELLPELYMCIQTYEDTDIIDEANLDEYWNRISTSSLNVAEFDSIKTNSLEVIDADEDTPGFVYSNIVQTKNFSVLSGYGSEAVGEVPFSISINDSDNSTLDINTDNFLVNSSTIMPAMSGEDTLVEIGSISNRFKRVYTDNISSNEISAGNLDPANKIILSSNIIPNVDQGLDIGSSNNRFNQIYTDQLQGNALSANYADLAEYYYADKAYEPGTIIEVGGEYEVRATSTLSSRRIVGVVSENPGVILNQDVEAVTGSTPILIGLLGRVHVKVAGSVSKGDFIESSDIEGVGRSIINYQGHHSRTIVGMSLEDNDEEGIKKVLCFIGK